MQYAPLNWYWIVAGSTTQVWSSSRCAYVPLTDATYVAWLAAGGVPSKIMSVSDLNNVMLSQWAPMMQGAGVVITSTATPALNGTYDISPTSIAKIVALSTGIAAGKPLPGGLSTFNYPDASSVMHAFTAANFLNFAAAIETFIYNFEQALNTLLNGGAATLPSNALTIA